MEQRWGGRGRLRESPGLLAARPLELFRAWFTASLQLVAALWRLGSSFLADLGLSSHTLTQPLQLSALPFLPLRWPSKTSKKELSSRLEAVLVGQFLPCTRPLSRHQVEDRSFSQLWSSLELSQRTPHPDTDVSCT